ncbi:serine/threonine-protein kinase haspin-like [Dermacentor albipictus]|uniref:serine/threonine-protein kinase haspin-like n=1 Tax=Dermacentor albipictus TaxID=60249 RepID=UPI0031FC4396
MRDDGTDLRGNFAEELYYRTGSESTDDAEQIQLDNDDEDQPLLGLSDNYSDYQSSSDETRHSGGGDGDRSEVNNSGLSEESAYMKLPRFERSSEDVSTCFIDYETQEAWLSVAAAVDRPVDPRAHLPSSPHRPRNAFDRLFEARRQPEPVVFSTILQELGVENCVKLHESEHTDIFLASTVSGDTVVLKVCDCAHGAKYLQCLINEIRIGWSLTTLAEGLENQTRGFPRFHLTRRVWDSYPRLLESARTSCLKRRKSADLRVLGRKLCSPYVVLCIDNGGEPLSEMTLGQFDSALQIRSVVQQVALVVAVAEAELEFEHRVLTPGHVLLKPVRGRVAHYRFMNNAVSVE